MTALPAFDAAARHLSFTKAATELHVTHGAVSRAIAQGDVNSVPDEIHEHARSLTKSQWFWRAIERVRLSCTTGARRGDVVPNHIFAPDSPPSEHLGWHPFGENPAFEHAGFRLYQAEAITGYFDEALAGPRLQPDGARSRAPMTQIISILDKVAQDSGTDVLVSQHQAAGSQQHNLRPLPSGRGEPRDRAEPD